MRNQNELFTLILRAYEDFMYAESKRSSKQRILNATILDFIKASSGDPDREFQQLIRKFNSGSLSVPNVDKDSVFDIYEEYAQKEIKRALKRHNPLQVYIDTCANVALEYIQSNQVKLPAKAKKQVLLEAGKLLVKAGK